MPNRIPTGSIPTPPVRVSKSAQPAAKPSPNPTTAFDKDVAARFKGGVYNSGNYKGPKGGDAASMQKTQNKMMGKK